MNQNPQAIAELTKATLNRGGRTLWNNIDLSIKPGEFIAVLGPNGAGKTTLLRVLLGLLPLTQGSVQIFAKPVVKGNPKVGYIPQQKNFDRALPIRGQDLVQLGLDGNKYGFKLTNQRDKKAVEQAIKSVGAQSYAFKPIGLLSGGEQQRLRIAQALVSNPKLLLCDEPLLSLDVASQASITSLIDSYRKRSQAAVVFVTHEINPVLPYVDRVLYIANGRWLIDKPEKILDSKTLSNLYDTPIEVIRLKDRVLVIGAEDTAAAHHHHEADL
jgi:zinc/manganese transport system ATP-binding protein